MPLHLLGKKSWNVYNTENIARVGRDEAEAKAREEDEERQRRGKDADLRLRALKGEPTEHTLKQPSQPSSQGRNQDLIRHKHRRLAGEDDTDRDFRLAQDHLAKQSGKNETALFDANGHIDLVAWHPPSKTIARTEKADEDPYAMRLADAAGLHPDTRKPWYTSSTQTNQANASQSDVWGNEDPSRQAREQQRVVAGDPLQAMKKGVKKLRENERQRKDWIEERERDLNEVEKLAEHDRKLFGRKRHADEDSLGDFDLDHGYRQRQRSRSPSRRKRRHNYRDLETRPQHRHGHMTQRNGRGDG